MCVVAAIVDQSNNQVSTDDHDDEQFADFASFQASSLPPLTPLSTVASHTRPELEASDATFAEMSPAADQRRVLSASLCVSDGSASAVSSTGGSDKYRMIKEMISNPSLFASGPPPVSSEPVADGHCEWSDYQGLSVVGVVHSGVQSSSVADFRPSSSPGGGDWADFQGTSAVAVSDSSQAVANISRDFVPSEFDIDRTPVRTKPSAIADYSSSVTWFGMQQQQNDAVLRSKPPSHVLFSSGALDFSPPELPPENDDDDAGFLGLGDGGGHGISSLSTLDLEDEIAADGIGGGGSGGGFLKPIATSHSASSFEFTGWRQGSKRRDLPAPGADDQSTSSLDLQPAVDVSGGSPGRSPSRPTAEADSQSESSLEFFPPSDARPPVSGVVRADFDAASLQSLELKPAAVSPGEEPTPGAGLDDTGSHSVGGLDNVQESWIPSLKIPSGPVDVKDLLNEGSLGMFGDRYSHLMHELQVNLRSLFADVLLTLCTWAR